MLPTRWSRVVKRGLSASAPCSAFLSVRDAGAERGQTSFTIEGSGGGQTELASSEISCLGGHDGWKGAQPCRDAKSLIFLMPFWTSFWLGATQKRPSIRTAFLTA